jgi:hypothetical protein
MDLFFHGDTMVMTIVNTDIEPVMQRAVGRIIQVEETIVGFKKKDQLCLKPYGQRR